MRLLLTKDLTLRSWEPDDADVVFDIYSRWSVMRWLGMADDGLRDRWFGLTMRQFSPTAGSA